MLKRFCDQYFIDSNGIGVVLLFGKFVCGLFDGKEIVSDLGFGSPVIATFAKSSGYLATDAVRVDGGLLAAWSGEERFEIGVAFEHFFDQLDQIGFAVLL